MTRYPLSHFGLCAACHQVNYIYRAHTPTWTVWLCAYDYQLLQARLEAHYASS